MYLTEKNLAPGSTPLPTSAALTPVTLSVALPRGCSATVEDLARRLVPSVAARMVGTALGPGSAGSVLRIRPPAPRRSPPPPPQTSSSSRRPPQGPASRPAPSSSTFQVLADVSADVYAALMERAGATGLLEMVHKCGDAAPLRYTFSIASSAVTFAVHPVPAPGGQVVDVSADIVALAASQLGLRVVKVTSVLHHLPPLLCDAPGAASLDVPTGDFVVVAHGRLPDNRSSSSRGPGGGLGPVFASVMVPTPVAGSSSAASKPHVQWVDFQFTREPPSPPAPGVPFPEVERAHAAELAAAATLQADLAATAAAEVARLKQLALDDARAWDTWVRAEAVGAAPAAGGDPVMVAADAPRVGVPDLAASLPGVDLSKGVAPGSPAAEAVEELMAKHASGATKLSDLALTVLEASISTGETRASRDVGLASAQQQKAAAKAAGSPSAWATADEAQASRAKQSRRQAAYTSEAALLSLAFAVGMGDVQAAEAIFKAEVRKGVSILRYQRGEPITSVKFDGPDMDSLDKTTAVYFNGLDLRDKVVLLSGGIPCEEDPVTRLACEMLDYRSALEKEAAPLPPLARLTGATAGASHQGTKRGREGGHTAMEATPAEGAGLLPSIAEGAGAAPSSSSL